MNASTIIATFMSADGQRGFELQADGQLVEKVREGQYGAWSPPKVVAELKQSDSSFIIPYELHETAHKANVAAIEQIIKATQSSAQGLFKDGVLFGLGRALDVLNGRR